MLSWFLVFIKIIFSGLVAFIKTWTSRGVTIDMLFFQPSEPHHLDRLQQHLPAQADCSQWGSLQTTICCHCVSRTQNCWTSTCCTKTKTGHSYLTCLHCQDSDLILVRTRTVMMLIMKVWKMWPQASPDVSENEIKENGSKNQVFLFWLRRCYLVAFSNLD